MATSYPCPKCGRSLEPCGEVTVEDGPPLPVYQCEECELPWVVDGVEIPTALTFVVKAGVPLHAETLEALGPLPSDN